MTLFNTIIKPIKGDIRAIIPITGTTVNALTEIVDLDTRWLEDTTFTISNTGDTNKLDYEILTYNDYASGTAITAFSNTVNVNDEDQIILTRHARIKVKINSTTTDSHTTYQIDCISGR